MIWRYAIMLSDVLGKNGILVTRIKRGRNCSVDRLRTLVPLDEYDLYHFCNSSFREFEHENDFTFENIFGYCHSDLYQYPVSSM